MLVISKLERREDSDPEPVYDLDLGSGEVHGCNFADLSDSPSGHCESFSYEPPSYLEEAARGANRVEQSSAIDIYLHADKSFAETAAKCPLDLGQSGQVRVTGTVKMDSEDILVRNAVVEIPDPIEDGVVEVAPIETFSLFHTPV